MSLVNQANWMIFMVLVFGYLLIWLSREFALKLLLLLRGQQVMAKCVDQRELKHHLRGSHLYIYQYTANNAPHQHARFAGAFDRKLNEVQDEIYLLYLASRPSISRPYSLRFFLVIGLLTVALLGFLCAAMIYILTNSMLIFVVWLLAILIFMLIPGLIEHPILTFLFLDAAPRQLELQGGIASGQRHEPLEHN